MLFMNNQRKEQTTKEKKEQIIKEQIIKERKCYLKLKHELNKLGFDVWCSAGANSSDL